MNNGNHSAIWKFVAGSLITHLPEYCIHAMTTYLAHEVLHHRRLVPQVVDFGPEYESVLEYFTASMLGIPEDVPQQKYGLLTKLLESTGFNTIASLEEQQHRSKLDVVSFSSIICIVDHSRPEVIEMIFITLTEFTCTRSSFR